jgi:Synaptobrevin
VFLTFPPSSSIKSTNVPPKSNFAFLQQIQTEFTKQNRARRIANANAYGMDKKFSPYFRSTVHYYNVNHGKLRQEEKVTKLLAQVEDMKEIMGRNIQLSMRRAANMEKLVGISESLELDTEVFYKRAKTDLKRRQRKYFRVYLTMVVMALTVLYMILVGVCGWSLDCKARFS